MHKICSYRIFINILIRSSMQRISSSIIYILLVNVSSLVVDAFKTCNYFLSTISILIVRNTIANNI